MRSVFEKLNEQIRPTAYVDCRAFLLEYFQKTKTAVGRYSYAEFAADLGFAPTGFINQIVKGRRPLTVRMSTRIAAALGLNGLERRYFVTLTNYTNEKSTKIREELFQKLISLKTTALPSADDQDILTYFSEWYHPVIRELVGRQDFSADPAWIAENLIPRIRPNQAKNSLALLKRLGLIKLVKNRLQQTEKSLSTGPQVKNISVIRYHQQMIDLGKEALTRTNAKDRNITALTVRISAADAEVMMQKLYDFQMQLLKEAEAKNDGEKIYQVNMQMFPVAK